MCARGRSHHRDVIESNVGALSSTALWVGQALACHNSESGFSFDAYGSVEDGNPRQSRQPRQIGFMQANAAAAVATLPWAGGLVDVLTWAHAAPHQARPGAHCQCLKYM